MGVPRAMLPEGRLSGNKVKLGDLSREELFGPSLGDSGRTCFPAFLPFQLPSSNPTCFPHLPLGRKVSLKDPLTMKCWYVIIHA